MRFAGALLLSLPFLGLALRRVARLRRREERLSAFCEFFRLLGGAAAWRQAALPALLGQIGGQLPGFDFIPGIGEAYARCGDLAQAWEEAAGRERAWLRSEEQAALLRFGTVFFSARPSALSAGCARAAAEFAEYARLARGERLRQSRLTLTFGALGAALFVILLV